MINLTKTTLISFFACLFLFGIKTSAQTKHAIIIGIGDYPKENGWRKINGNNDIEIIKITLYDYGFNISNIKIIKDNQATKQAIVSAFENLIKKSTIGDKIYIHFSGHGQQITDIHGDNISGFDEAWIPYDAQKKYVKGQYEGENHLVDAEINTLLHRLRNAVGSNGEILVVVDACHSGGSTRSENDDEVIVRGANDNFVIPQKVKPAFKGENATSWTTISACESYQSNYECKVNNTHFGSLSYAIFFNRDSLNTDSYLSAFAILKQTIGNLVEYPQTPVIDNGNKTNRIFAKP